MISSFFTTEITETTEKGRNRKKRKGDAPKARKRPSLNFLYSSFSVVSVCSVVRFPSPFKAIHALGGVGDGGEAVLADGLAAFGAVAVDTVVDTLNGKLKLLNFFQCELAQSL